MLAEDRPPAGRGGGRHDEPARPGEDESAAGARGAVAPAPAAEERPFGGARSAAKFLGRFAPLDLATLGEAVQAWRRLMATSTDGWFAAEGMVARAVRAAALYAEQNVLLEHMMELFRRGPWFTRGAYAGTPEASAQYVATTAMLAVLVRDYLQPHEFDLLYHPFARLIAVEELERE